MQSALTWHTKIIGHIHLANLYDITDFLTCMFYRKVLCLLCAICQISIQKTQKLEIDFHLVYNNNHSIY